VSPRGGRLILCGTPIGNLEDASTRLVRTLEKADVIACEEAQRTRKLLSHFGIRAPSLVIYNDGNERRTAPGLVEEIARGKTVALVSSAGMPGLADPGYRLVRACIEAGFEVDVVPGPTAVISALVVSGLPTDSFVFEGWLPKKSGERTERVTSLVAEPRTLVFFCSPHRIDADLKSLSEGLGDRRAALVRELTKLHQEIRRGTLPELLADLADNRPKGEMVLVVEGSPGVAERPDAKELARRARKLMNEGVHRKEALTEVAKTAGVPRREVFEALLND
jgi:16S rRNA (cytidine1402-2'-O)-methyltransferase